jgi:signal transduction histidine kinase
MSRDQVATDWVSQALDRPFRDVEEIGVGDRRRFHLIALNAYVSVTFAVPLMLANLALGPVHQGLVNGLAGMGFLINLALLRKHRNATWAGVAAAALTLLSIGAEVHAKGGFLSPAMDLLQLTPLVAIAVWGYRTAVYTTVTTLTMVVWFWWALPGDVLFEPAVEVGYEALAYRMFTLIGVIVIVEMIDFERRMVRGLVSQAAEALVGPSPLGTPKLAHAQHMVTLDRIAVGVGHEINTPLATAMGQLELAMAAKRCGHDPRDHILEADQALHRVADLVSDLRDYTLDGSRSEGERIRLSRALTQALKLVENDLRHRAELHLELVCNREVMGGLDVWTRVFVQLISSVCNTIEPGNANRHELTVRLHARDNGCEVVIEESPLGLGEENTEKRPTPEPSARGTGRKDHGLGTFLSRTLINSLGGTLDVDIGIGTRGARITMWTPALPRDEEA